jgi:hypothetical protein
VIEKDARKIDELDRHLDDMKGCTTQPELTDEFIISEARYVLGKFYSPDWDQSYALAGEENNIGIDNAEARKQVRQLKRFLMKHTGSDHYTES